MRLNIVLEVRVKLLVKELQGIGGCLMGNQLELNLGDTPNEDEFSKSKGKKTTGLDKVQGDIRCAGTSNYTFENGTPWHNKNESS